MAGHFVAPEIRFWRHVQKTDSCWLWIGRKNVCGYGTLSLNRPDRVWAHRFSYELANGPIPNGLRVLHVCDNRACVNPAHLFIGTQADNMRDMATKGRSSRGEHRYCAKLTEADVIEIRRCYARGGINQKSLAKMYGVARPTISKVLLRKKWRHVDATST